MNEQRPPANRRSRAVRVARVLLVTVAALYLLAAAAVWWVQTRVLYHPRKTVDVTPTDVGLVFQPVQLPLNGERLAGWWVPSKTSNAATILYLHGNAGNVSANADQVQRLAVTGLNIFIFDYRGYGESTGGPPRERLVYQDAERAWTYLVRERGIRPSGVVIYGHSLGGAVAVDLASRHPDAGGLITENTFTSIIDMAEGTLFAWLPLRMIVTERFDAASRIGSIRVPKLMLHGDADPMIPVRLARRLYDAAAEPKHLAVIAGGDHEDSAELNPAAYFTALNGFLRTYHLSPLATQRAGSSTLARR
jgi:alpha-beta hydrolase superfamily lysophospholipase